MARSPRQRRPRPTPAERHRAPRPPGPAESPAAEWLTVGWAMSLLTTLGCELLTSAVHLWLRWGQATPALELLAGLLLFASVVVGLLAVALLGLVQWLRRMPLSTGAVTFSLSVSAAPAVLVLARWWVAG